MPIAGSRARVPFMSASGMEGKKAIALLLSKGPHALADVPAFKVVPGDGGDRTTSRGRAPPRLRAGGCRAMWRRIGFLRAGAPWRVQPQLEPGASLAYNAGRPARARKNGARSRTVAHMGRAPDGTPSATPRHDSGPPLGCRCCVRHAGGTATGRLHAFTRRAPDSRAARRGHRRG